MCGVSCHTLGGEWKGEVLCNSTIFGQLACLFLSYAVCHNGPLNGCLEYFPSMSSYTFPSLLPLLPSPSPSFSLSFLLPLLPSPSPSFALSFLLPLLPLLLPSFCFIRRNGFRSPFHPSLCFLRSPQTLMCPPYLW